MLEMRSIDVEAKISEDVGDWTCLMTAAYFGLVDIFRLLIGKGAQIEAKIKDGSTSLHWPP
jgi:ankyrin repeat protein